MERFTIGFCLAVSVGACAVDDGEGATVQPIATVQLDTGLIVEFYEPVPGSILTMESAEVGVAPLGGSRARPVDRYRELAPGQPVPIELLEAQQRADELGGLERRAIGLGDLPPAPVQRPSVGYIDNQSCDDHWFEDSFCGGGWDWEMCLLNHWNGAYAQAGGVNYAYYATCADIGNITLKVEMDDGDDGGGIWTVLEGHWRAYQWFNAWGEDSTRGDVLNASNNRFHFAVCYMD
jgi:hypothetical protein